MRLLVSRLVLLSMSRLAWICCLIGERSVVLWVDVKGIWCEKTVDKRGSACVRSSDLSELVRYDITLLLLLLHHV